MNIMDASVPRRACRVAAPPLPRGMMITSSRDTAKGCRLRADGPTVGGICRIRKALSYAIDFLIVLIDTRCLYA